MVDLGAWSLLPPVLAIGFAIATRKVFQSLILGILAGGFLLAWSQSVADTPPLLLPLAALAGGFMQGVGFIIDGVAAEGNATIFIFVLLLGAIIALMQRAGAVRGFGQAAMRFAGTRRRGQFLAWLTGSTALAVDDHFNVIAAGTMFRPVTDRLQVSREKLAYIIDSTGSPVAILNPVSTWAGFMAVFAATSLTDLGLDISGFATFIASIPYNLYAWLTLLFVLLVAVTRLEYGPMRKAELRAAQGDVLRPGARPLVSRELAQYEDDDAVAHAYNLLLPLLFLFLAVLMMLWYTGGFDQPFWQAVPDADAPFSLAVSTAATLLFTVILYRVQDHLDSDRAVSATLDGFKAMLPAMAILALAFGLGNAVGAVGLGQWVVSVMPAEVAAAALPLLVFVVSAVMAFATGTSFGTFAIMIPLSFGLVAARPDSLLWFGPTLAAVSGGGVFGDHCSPISDTTVLSSMAAQSDHIDHVRTQLPYAMTTAGLAVLGYGAIAMGTPLWLVWLGLLAALTASVLVVRRVHAPVPNPPPVVAARKAGSE